MTYSVCLGVTRVWATWSSFLVLSRNCRRHRHLDSPAFKLDGSSSVLSRADIGHQLAISAQYSAVIQASDPCAYVVRTINFLPGPCQRSLSDTHYAPQIRTSTSHCALHCRQSAAPEIRGVDRPSTRRPYIDKFCGHNKVSISTLAGIERGSEARLDYIAFHSRGQVRPSMLSASPKVCFVHIS